MASKRTTTELFREIPGGDPTKVGYMRVSTADQTHDLQLDALTAHGCGRIYLDTASGATDSRPALTAALEHVRKGDQLVVWRTDRLGRSLRHLLEVVGGLHADGVQFVSTTEAIDTSTAGGEMVFSMIGAVAQFERRIISERTKAGLEAARTRGKKGGRKPSLSPAQVRNARRMRDEDGMTLDEIAAELEVSRSSVIRHLKAADKTGAVQA